MSFWLHLPGHPAFMCNVSVRNDSVCDNHHHHARHQTDTITTDTTLTILTLSSHPQHQHWHHPQNTNIDAIPTVSAWTPHPWHQPPPPTHPPPEKRKRKKIQYWSQLHMISTDAISIITALTSSAQHDHWWALHNLHNISIDIISTTVNISTTSVEHWHCDYDTKTTPTAPALKTTISNGTLVGHVNLMALDLHKFSIHETIHLTQEWMEW